MSEKTRIGAALAALLCAAACGGGGGGGNDDSSGVDPDQTLDEASSQERMDVCEWYLDQFVDEDVVRLGCYIGAITLSEGSDQDCQMLADACLEDAEGEEVDLGGCAASSEGGDLPECAADVTVGEYEACLGAQANQVAEVSSTISCDTTSDELIELLDFGRRRACQPIEEVCPELLDNGG
jgi:hypothetical protein